MAVLLLYRADYSLLAFLGLSDWRSPFLEALQSKCNVSGLQLVTNLVQASINIKVSLQCLRMIDFYVRKIGMNTDKMSDLS